MYSIRQVNETDQSKWQKCLAETKELNHSFDWRWKDIIQEVFGHKPIYLLVEDEKNNPLAVAPFFHVSSLLFGSAIISVPYLNGGGIAVDSSLTELEKNSIYEIFSEKFISLSKDYSTKYSELRFRNQVNYFSSLDFIKLRKHKVAMTRMLLQDPESMFSSFPPKLRSQIRKPSKESCTSVSEPGHLVSNKMISHFYQVFSTNMRDLGIPVYPKDFFSKALSAFGKKSRLTIVYHHKKPVAAGITIGTTKMVEVLWASSLKKYKKISPNMLLYWEMIKHAIIDGYLSIDFGRSSKDSGTFKFKEQWGTSAEQLYWYYYVSNGEIPEISSQNQKMSLLISLWKQMPLPATQILGKYITKSLP